MGENAERPLSEFATNTYSQYGEDGIIAECLSRISRTTTLDKWCVEFGAWDGVHLSNTCRLIREENYSAVLVEGDEDRFKELQQNLPEERALKFRRWVSLTGEGRLENILAETPIPQDFDVLSIDIDSCDWHVWESVKAYRPKLVCIEFNPTIPNCVSFVQRPDFSIRNGNSARAIYDLAEQKGYVLIAANTVNLFFVDAAFADVVLGSARPTLEELRPERDFVTYVFSGYNGEVLTTAPVSLQWHGMQRGAKQLQMLPKALHRFPDEYNRWQKLCFKLAKAINQLMFRK